jgi:hypothetical protein
MITKTKAICILECTPENLQNRYSMITFLIITCTVVIVILVIRSANKSQPIITREKSEGIVSSLQKPPLPKEAKELFDILDNINQSGTGTNSDVIPDGFGEFGLDVTNPIPVNSVFGSMEYLRKLRTIDGKIVENKRTGSVMAPNIAELIDEYEISVEGQFITHIYICPYHKKNSERPPKGFRLSAIPFL